jgi:CheY-like chemotaxis protein
VPRVLFVDSEPAVSRLAKRVLEKAGFEVLVATDLPEALDLLKSHTVAGLLADSTLPEVILEALGRYPDLPVCCMAAQMPDNAMLWDIPVVLKPFEPRNLIQAVEKMINLHRRVLEAKSRWLASRSELEEIVSVGPVIILQPDSLFRVEQAKRKAAAEFTEYEYERTNYRNEIEKHQR